MPYYPPPPSSAAGTGAVPTTSSTQTITHGLGRIPVVIRLSGIGAVVGNSSARWYSTSEGVWTASTGNDAVFMIGGGTTANPTATGTYAVYITSNDGTSVTYAGAVGNVGPTSFDIVWTLSAGGAATDGAYLWECQ